MVCFADSPRRSWPTSPGPASCIGVILTGDHCTESPFASSGRYPSECHLTCDIDRHYSILFAPMGSCARPKPSRSLGVSPWATSPCRLLRTPAGSWPFPTLSPQSFYGCLDPYPAALIRCTRSFLPGRHRPHLSLNRFGAQEPPPWQQLLWWPPFSGLQSFAHVQAPILARPPGCSYRYRSGTSHRAARPFTPRNERVGTLHELWQRYISESSNWYGGTFTR